MCIILCVENLFNLFFHLNLSAKGLEFTFVNTLNPSADIGVKTDSIPLFWLSNGFNLRFQTVC